MEIYKHAIYISQLCRHPIDMAKNSKMEKKGFPIV
jgi:hypothetical protein